MSKWVHISLKPEEVAFVKDEAIKMAEKSEIFVNIEKYVNIVHSIDEAIETSNGYEFTYVHISLNPDEADAILKHIKACTTTMDKYEQVEKCVKIVDAFEEAKKYAKKREDSEV